MALDSVELDNLQAADDVATDLIASKHHQLVKVTYGALGASNVVTSTGTNPLPVALSDTDNAVLDNIQTAVQLSDDVVATLGTTTYSEATTKGAVIGAVRNDTLAPLVNTDNEIAPLQVDELGALYGNQGNRISTLNSRSKATLAASGTFQGTGEDVSKYGRVGVSITTSNATDGVLTMEVSRNNVDWGGPTRTWADTRYAQPHMWNIVEKYFRILYTNGTTEALDLEIQVQYSNNADIFLGHQLNETLLNETEAIITRSVGVGQDPNSIYVNEPVSGVDNDNSSTTNLTSGTSLTFTGEWHDVEAYHGITVLVDGTSSGDVAGTLKLQFSHDGSTIHRDIQISTDAVTDTLPRTLGIVANYFRVEYVSASTLISFTIQTMLHTQQVQLVSRLDGTIQGNEDVTTVRSVIVGETGGGSFVNIKSSNGGAINVDLADLDGNTIATNSGSLSTGVQRVAIATNDVNMSAIKTAVETVAAAVVTEMQVDVVTSALPSGAATSSGQLAAGHTVTANAGTNLNTSALLTTTAHDGAFGTAGTADAQVRSVQGIASGTPVIVDMGANNDVTIIAATSGGMSYDMLALAAEDNDKVIKGSGGTLYGISVQSIDATPVYLKLFNATSITAGVTNADLQYMCPAAATAANGAGIVKTFGPQGIAFGTGIVALISTGIALNDNTAVSANEVVVTLEFK